MVILAFEASGSALSAAVLSDDDAVSSVWEEARFGQAARLVPLAVSALTKAGKSFADITHVAAGCGPGSFTGIRVALAAAKGVCLAQDAPGLGISGLQALAHNARADAAGRPILAVADTRRGNLYAQIFTAKAAPASDVFDATDTQLPVLLAPSIAGQEIVLVGYAATQLVPLFADHGHHAVALADIAAAAMPTSPDAEMIARLAADHIAHGHMPALSPLYLADPRLGPKKAKKT
ncbi:MAG: tRNA (adenosine(37)-N6)-threonylcarbamoyltransferase complex dimerization subunit type 1 TsaB [Alphaproteobacteria bacterium]|nr:tRNA (adenosine(37)-N6)-threonylcarbamoyltransferase complex dimerization subunit type 1 TsaB [Alphaproteobacteria bacterium]